MRLYIGGAGHGQAALAEKETGRTPQPCTPETALTAPAIGEFHRLTREILRRGGDCQAFAEKLLAKNPDAVVVCDEIGLGIVPLYRFEREWREETGRALCILAAGAERVIRVFCGIGQVLK